ncbi:MAG TPA: type II toxin-antitoxin system PemK/MazF family toxin [Lacipirellulaceae bacterium]|nr:type II toxin-antitoxin system PemK/MazF family toxin [Lacipirellulaceae bacterium]HMP05426.1 type II toxin-antitoxin system PemK/MazF family toxin [Lacipirellulaceae bacterium]
MTRGDVILCRFPHARGTPPKLRPALVVQSDYYNSRIANVLVAGITSNL